ncbi:MAG: hypothetical protein FWE84_00005 [Firmicutes bacterium]|nr:hypothetical protein [Bacillota bacterium]
MTNPNLIDNKFGFVVFIGSDKRQKTVPDGRWAVPSLSRLSSKLSKASALSVRLK